MENTTLSQREHKLNLLKNELGLRGGRLRVLPVPKKPSPKAHINLGTDAIEISYAPDWNPASHKNARNFVERRNIEDPVQTILEDIVRHETGHWELVYGTGHGCPYNLEHQDLILDTVGKVMKDKDRFSQEGLSYLTNLISDVINNMNVSNYSNMDGLALFLAQQGELAQGKFTPLYEAFVDLNLYLWQNWSTKVTPSGHKLRRKLLSSYLTHDNEITAAVRNIIRRLNLSRDHDHNMNVLFNKGRWGKIYRFMAEELLELMEAPPTEMLIDGMKYGDTFHRPLEKKLKDSKEMGKILKKRYENSEGVPSYMDQFEALDWLYQTLASEIPMRADVLTEGESFPLVTLNHKRFNEDLDSIHKLVLKPILDGEGFSLFATPDHQLTIEGQFRRGRVNYPALNVALIDTSGSMKNGTNGNSRGNTSFIPWGDQSKYHYAVLSWYGVVKYLQMTELASGLNYNLITFSTKTEGTGEQDYDSLDQLKRKILNPDFGGGTYIDMNILKEHASTPGSIFITISDGEIHNWEGIKKDFTSFVSDKHYVHFQIGSSENVGDLEQLGTIIYVNRAEDLPKSMVDVTSKFYQGLAEVRL